MSTTVLERADWPGVANRILAEGDDRAHVVRPLINPKPDASRSSLAVSASLLLTALLGAGQALLLPFIAGAGEQIDAFLAAYALCLFVTSLGVTLRGSVVLLLSAPTEDEELRRDAGELLGHVLALAAVLCCALLVGAPVLGRLVANGLSDHAQKTAVEALAILAPTAYLQIQANAQSAVLSVSRRFSFSAALSVGSSALAVGCSAILLSLVGVLGSALGILIGASVNAAGHTAYLMRLGVRIRFLTRGLFAARQRSLLGVLACYAAPSMAGQLILAICLAAVSREEGAITAYTYSYFVIGLMLNMTSVSLGIVMLPDLMTRTLARGRAAAGEYIARVMPYTFAVLVPMLAGFALFGRPLLEGMFSTALPAHDIRLIHEIGLVFCLMALATAFFQAAIVGTVACGLARLSLVVAVGSVALHAAAVLPAASQGPLAVAVAQAAASTIIAGVLIVGLLARQAPAVVGRALRRSAPAFAVSATFFAVRLPLGAHPGPGVTLAGLVTAAAAYAVLALRLWPDVGRQFVTLGERSERLS